ncbi:VID27 cytoplasmic protein-domain-containing protein [Dipodascopsis uninucleata]
MNFLKKVLGSSPKQELVCIPSGRLYLARSQNSVKGYSECIFKDAVAVIRRTTTDFHFQLVIQRAYEEGEEQLEDDDDEEPLDEYTFLLDEALHLRLSKSVENQTIFSWKDLSGDPGDIFEFICDDSTSVVLVKDFMQIAIQCQYERKYNKSSKLASNDDLAEFVFDDEEISSPLLSASASPVGLMLSETTTRGSEIIDAKKAPSIEEHSFSGLPEGYTVKEVLGTVKAELNVFDATSGVFMLQDDDVKATIKDLGNWNYWLDIEGSSHHWLGSIIAAEINPVFNFEHLSFIFNYFADDGSAASWLLHFENADALETFQELLMRALWETLNQQSWFKTNKEDQDYVLEAFNDITMTDADEEPDEEEEAFEDANDDVRKEAELYDNDEEYDDELGNSAFSGEGKNSQLAVGYKHDRSFVVRGNKIGVFTHTPANTLEFSTTIENLKTPSGKNLSPSKVMLHAEDSTMILQSPSNKNSLYSMDLEYGKIVDEWKVHDDVPVTAFTPSKKFSQMTGEQTFVGMSDNSLFRIDPRLAGNKLVDSEFQKYATKNAFSAISTTDKGYLAVASAKGDIRLYDRLGIRAKTAIPALGEPIIGLDVSADGKWILATCKTYLLLIDATIKNGKNAGTLGFEKSFSKDSKPRPKCLQLSPEHVAQMQAETKQPLAFTQGHFNTGLGSKETTIVSSSGPYVITWNLKQVLKGDKTSYTIKRYGDKIAADNFKFGSDKNVIVALPDDVGMVNKRSFRKPTRESIATPVKAFRS